MLPAYNAGMDYQHLTIDSRDHTATVTFNRPNKANALNFDHLAEIEAAALSFRDQTHIRAVIFTGAGRHFSSGADLTDPGHAYQGPLVQRRRRTRIGERTIEALYNMDQVTIAAWNGAAMGGGACITTAIDLRVGADDCFMQYPEVDIGMNLMWKSLPLITHLVGPARAKRLVAGGERIHARQLEAWGVLDYLVPRSELLSKAQEVAEFYAAKPPIAVQMIKRSVNAIVSASDNAIMHMDVDQNLLTQSTSDRATAIKNYLEKQQTPYLGE